MFDSFLIKELIIRVNAICEYVNGSIYSGPYQLNLSHYIGRLFNQGFLSEESLRDLRHEFKVSNYEDFDVLVTTANFAREVLDDLPFIDDAIKDCSIAINKVYNTNNDLDFKILEIINELDYITDRLEKLGFESKPFIIKVSYSEVYDNAFNLINVIPTFGIDHIKATYRSTAFLVAGENQSISLITDIEGKPLMEEISEKFDDINLDFNFDFDVCYNADTLRKALAVVYPVLGGIELGRLASNLRSIDNKPKESEFLDYFTKTYVDGKHNLLSSYRGVDSFETIVDDLFLLHKEVEKSIIEVKL